ncbi:neuropeptide F isoform X2 [Penaeus vannamei]|uniref:Preproneuropeptide F I n=1 Tax=Penaeus vannamei TaxID=6689 RepID=F6KM62_PENVA|nr:neuropeptide F-like isoform X2 [Penaeus vannamei]AEC12204.1 preproneuropeptide F I [Penaeus vannamei]
MCRVSQMWAAVVVVVVLVVATDLGAVAEAKPDPSQLANMAEALKYLQELDKYYSQVSRPRFGKRSDYAMPSGDALMEASERLLETLARRR